MHTLKENKQRHKEDKMKEVYSEWLDNLTILDLEKLTRQGYYIMCSNGHIIAILPEGTELKY